MPAPSSWRLTYPGTDLSFGGLTDVATFGEAPDLGTLDIATDDTNLPRSDGVAFGNDYFGGRTITFPTLYVGGSTESEVRSKMSTLATAWRGDAIRQKPGAVATLRISRPDGDDRVTFGRPRRFSRGDELTPNGLGIATADFAASSPDFYGTTEQSQLITFAPSLGGGLVAPLSAPLSTTADSDRSTNVVVSTELPAWPTVTIHGPITNPDLIVLGVFHFALNDTLAYDESVTITTAPWARTILRSNGTSAAGKLSRTSTRLANAAIPAGSYDLSLRGKDATGTSWASVSWLPRFSTI